MAAGIGEASAILSVVSLGFSIAAALNTYVSAVSAAPEEVEGLSSDIDGTLAHLRILQNLIEDNKSTKIWDSDGLHIAERAIKDCEKIIKKLRKLLQKSNWRSHDDEAIENNEIDLSKFEKATWPRLKPDVDLCKGELQRIKINILLANSAYSLGMGTTATQKAKQREILLGLSERQRRNAQKMRRIREGRLFGSTATTNYRSSRHHSQYRYQDEMDIEVLEDFEKFVAQEEARKEEEQRAYIIAIETEKKVQEEEKRKKIEERAIKEHMKKIKKAEEGSRKMKEALSRTLGERAGLTEDQLKIVLNHLPDSADDVARLLPHTDTTQSMDLTDNHTDLKTENNGPQVPAKQYKLARLRKLFQSHENNVWEESPLTKPPLPSVWRDPATKTGFANLEAWYISSDMSSRGEMVFPAPPPQAWQIKSLMATEAGNTKTKKRNKTLKEVYKIFQSLSPELAGQISTLLGNRADAKPHYEWSIILITPANETDRKRREVTIGPFRFHVNDLEQNTNEVYVVFKYENMYARSKNKDESSERSRSTDSIKSDVSMKYRQPDGTILAVDRARRSSSIPYRSSYDDTDGDKLRRDSRRESVYDPSSRVTFVDNRRRSIMDPSTVSPIRVSRIQSHGIPPAPSYYDGDRYLVPERRDVARERYRSRSVPYAGLDDYREVPYPVQPAQYAPGLEPKFPSPYGASYNPQVGPYKMPPPRNRYGNSYHDMGLVPYRNRTHSRRSSPSPPPPPGSAIINNRTYENHYGDDEVGIHIRRRGPEPTVDHRRSVAGHPLVTYHRRPAANDGERVGVREIIIEREKERHYDQSDDWSDDCSDNDELNMRVKKRKDRELEARKIHFERLRRKREEEQLRDIGRRPSVPAPTPRIVVEDDDHQSEEEVANRLVAKLTRPSKQLSVEDEISNGKNSTDFWKLSPFGTQLSDIPEASEDSRSRKSKELEKDNHNNMNNDKGSEKEYEDRWVIDKELNDGSRWYKEPDSYQAHHDRERDAQQDTWTRTVATVRREHYPPSSRMSHRGSSVDSVRSELSQENEKLNENSTEVVEKID